MIRTTLGLIALCTAIATAPSAPATAPATAPALQYDTAKGHPKSPGAMVRLRDGSLVHFKLIQKDVEVETKYGRLTVPLAETRRIEFGVRLSAEQTKDTNAWLDNLSAKEHSLREQAQAKIIEMGPLAFRAVKIRLGTETTLEGKRRLSVILRAIEEKHPADKLKMDDRDWVHTGDFPVIGRIITPEIKVTSKHFGDVMLKPADMETLRHSGADSRETMVKFGSDWQQTDVHLDSGDRAYVTASGAVDLWPQQPGQFLADPNGNQTNWHQGFPGGALLGKLGAAGVPFRIGTDYTVTGGGRLYLKINGSPWNNANSTGSYRVRIEFKD